MWPGKTINIPSPYDFYSHIPCGMWPGASRRENGYKHISTHTSRVGCDRNGQDYWGTVQYFYSHIPCGMWLFTVWKVNQAKTFLLTHPVWDVTKINPDLLPDNVNFYSHIPCGMWRYSRRKSKTIAWISTHTSRVGCDVVPRNGPKPPVISTHTSRVGCDKYSNF